MPLAASVLQNYNIRQPEKAPHALTRREQSVPNNTRPPVPIERQQRRENHLGSSPQGLVHLFVHPRHGVRSGSKCGSDGRVVHRSRRVRIR